MSEVFHKKYDLLDEIQHHNVLYGPMIKSVFKYQKVLSNHVYNVFMVLNETLFDVVFSRF